EFYIFFYATDRGLLSFPTRRSSDLHQADSLAIGRGGGALANQLQRLLVGVLHAEQEALPTRSLVEMQDIGIADDIVGAGRADQRSEEHTSELQSRENLVCRLLLEKK